MSQHTFIHVGDAHVHAANPRNADRLDSIAQIIDAGRACSTLAAWIWPGDLFHTKSTPEDRNALADRLQEMAFYAPVIVTVGNHETGADLRIFGSLRSRHHIIVAERPEVVRFETATGAKAACAVLPYPHRAGLVGAGVAPDQIGQVARDALGPIFHALADELRTAAAEGAIPLFAGHVNIGGAVTSTGQPSIGAEIELDPTLLGLLGPVAKMLNHIHRHQEIHGAVYAGSTARHDFGENEAKGFVAWTFDEAGGWSWQFRALNVPRQFTLSGELTPEGFTLDDTPDVPVIEGENDIHGADVRVRYRYRRADASVIDVGHIERLFAGARSLKLEPDPQHEVEVRAPEIVQAKTLDEKLQHYAARAGIVWTDGLAAKAAALQQQEAAVLLAALDARLAETEAPPQKAKVA